MVGIGERARSPGRAGRERPPTLVNRRTGRERDSECPSRRLERRRRGRPPRPLNDTSVGIAASRDFPVGDSSASWLRPTGRSALLSAGRDLAGGHGVSFPCRDARGRVGSSRRRRRWPPRPPRGHCTRAPLNRRERHRSSGPPQPGIERARRSSHAGRGVAPRRPVRRQSARTLHSVWFAGSSCAANSRLTRSPDRSVSMRQTSARTSPRPACSRPCTTSGCRLVRPLHEPPPTVCVRC